MRRDAVEELEGRKEDGAGDEERGGADDDGEKSQETSNPH